MMTAYQVIAALDKAGYRLSLEPPDTVWIKPVAPKISKQQLHALVEQARQRKPEILQALKAQEFKRLCSLVSESISRIALIYVECGYDEARRTGLWPKLQLLEHVIDEAAKSLDEARLLGALEAWERTWMEVRDSMSRQRYSPPAEPVEATA